MGRRKIEIKAIKDDRNRSVTFLKRKGGLFKKAHELSVLCSVDVAVIIFGQNGKLYEYSSGNIGQTLQRQHYYGQPHEHKGPADFADKDGGDDDEDDDQTMGDDLGPEERGITPQPPITYPSTAQMHHMRHGSTQSQSPPINNGMAPPVHRLSTPQPQHPIRRTSVSTHRRASSNLVPQNHPHPQATQPHAYGYGSLQQQQQQALYQQQQARAGAQMHPSQLASQMQNGHPSYQLSQQAFAQSQPPHSQMQQLYLQESRRQSMPLNFGMQLDRPQSVPAVQTPPQLSKPFQSPPMPGSPQQGNTPSSSSHVRSSSSYAAAGNYPSFQQSRQDYYQDGRDSRALSVDGGAVNRQRAVSAEPRPPFAPPGIIQPARSPLPNGSFSSAEPSPAFSRSSRLDSFASDSKRPRLAIQIPTGASPEDGKSGNTETSASPNRSRSSAQASSGTPSKAAAGTNSTTSNTTSHSHGSSIVLPPPSPSQPTSANPNPLSAGATGPPNPFARPLPPHAQHPHSHSHPQQPHAIVTNLSPSNKGSRPSENNTTDTPTPVSALPSRFMSNNELGIPSPGASLFASSDNWGSLWGTSGLMSAGGNGVTSPNGLFQPTPVRESPGGVAWPLREQGSGKAEGKMDVDISPTKDGTKENAGVSGDAEAPISEQEEQRMKRKIISPTEGWDERTKRGNWGM